jgi:hypothetical protein
LAHTVGPREIGLRSAFRESLDSFLALMHGHDGRGDRNGVDCCHAEG